MAATTFGAMQTAAETSSRVRKALGLVVFMGPSTAAAPAALTSGATSALEEMPAGFWPVGLLTDDGVSTEVNVEKEEQPAMGHTEPVRTDIVGSAKQVKFTAEESHYKALMELIYSVDLSGVVPDATTGEIQFSEPTIPVDQTYRCFAVSLDYVDGDPAKPVFEGDFYPKVKLASPPNRVKAKKGYVQWEVMLDVYTDDVLGYPVKHFLGGAGVDAAELGFA